MTDRARRRDPRPEARRAAPERGRRRRAWPSRWSWRWSCCCWPRERSGCGHSALAVPSAWPSPELQKKYDQIVARAASGQSTDVVLVGRLHDGRGRRPGRASRPPGPTSASTTPRSAGETLPTIAEWTTKVVVPRLHPKVVVVGFSSNELNPERAGPGPGLRAPTSTPGRCGPPRASAACSTGPTPSCGSWSFLYRYRASLRHPFDQGAERGVRPRAVAAAARTWPSPASSTCSPPGHPSGPAGHRRRHRHAGRLHRGRAERGPPARLPGFAAPPGHRGAAGRHAGDVRPGFLPPLGARRLPAGAGHLRRHRPGQPAPSSWCPGSGPSPSSPTRCT